MALVTTRSLNYGIRLLKRSVLYGKKIRSFPVYKMVDTCAAEFESHTPYFYSSYDLENESHPSTKESILVIWFWSDPDRTRGSNLITLQFTALKDPKTRL